MLGQIKSRKACCNDQVPGDLLKSAARSASQHFAPIFVKTPLLQQAALGWKRGIARPLHKGKGDPNCLDFYRGILLNGAAPK